MKTLSDLGFVSDATGDDVDNIATVIGQAMEALGLPDEIAGNGASITLSDDVDNVEVSVDTRKNQVNYVMPRVTTAPEFAACWGIALSTMETVDRASEAISKLVYREASTEEVRDFLNARWMASEVGIKSAVSSIIFENGISDPETVKRAYEAFSHVTGREGLSIPATAPEAAIALERVIKDLRPLGIVIDRRAAELFSMLISLRSNAIGAIQMTSGGGRYLVPHGFFDRVDAISLARSGESLDGTISKMSIGIALGEYVARKIGQPSPIPDPELIPTDEEMAEIESGIKEFSATLGGRRPSNTRKI